MKRSLKAVGVSLLFCACVVGMGVTLRDVGGPMPTVADVGGPMPTLADVGGPMPTIINLA